MNPRHFLFDVLLLTSLLCFGCSTPDNSFEPDQSLKLQNTNKSPLEVVTLNLLDPVAMATKTVEAHQTTYGFVYGAYNLQRPVTFFVSDESGKVWAGPPQDIYVEIESGIVGIRFRPAGMFDWTESLVPASGSKNIDEIIQFFEQTVDKQTLRSAYSSGGPEYRTAQGLNKRTDIRKIFPWSLFGLNSAPASNAKLSKAELSEGLLRFRIENPDTEFLGEVWVDPRTRQVVKSNQISGAIPASGPVRVRQ